MSVVVRFNFVCFLIVTTQNGVVFNVGKVILIWISQGVCEDFRFRLLFKFKEDFIGSGVMNVILGDERNGGDFEDDVFQPKPSH